MRWILDKIITRQVTVPDEHQGIPKGVVPILKPENLRVIPVQGIIVHGRVLRLVIVTPQPLFPWSRSVSMGGQVFDNPHGCRRLLKTPGPRSGNDWTVTTELRHPPVPVFGIVLGLFHHVLQHSALVDYVRGMKRNHTTIRHRVTSKNL